MSHTTITLLPSSSSLSYPSPISSFYPPFHGMTRLSFWFDLISIPPPDYVCLRFESFGDGCWLEEEDFSISEWKTRKMIWLRSIPLFYLPWKPKNNWNVTFWNIRLSFVQVLLLHYSLCWWFKIITQRLFLFFSLFFRFCLFSLRLMTDRRWNDSPYPPFHHGWL